MMDNDMKGTLSLVRLTFIALWLIATVAHWADILSEDTYSVFAIFAMGILLSTVAFEFLPHPHPKPQKKEEYGPGKWLPDVGAYDWEVDDKK